MSSAIRRRWWLAPAALALMLAAALLAPLAGPEQIDAVAAARAWWSGADAVQDWQVDILMNIRLPRVLLGLVAGATLALVGAVFQALLRNPLATPYTLGVASGGSFGAVAAIFLGEWAPALALRWGPIGLVQLMAFGGALAAIMIIWWLARVGGRLSTNELLLAGVTMGLIFSALIMATRYLASPHLLRDMDRWLMGQLSGATWGTLAAVALPALPAAVVLLLLARPLDQLALGEELAGGRGVDVVRLQFWSFLMGSLATGAVVATVGPIGFVGLIVPHAVRRLTGPGHVLLLPVSLLLGGVFLVACDTVARSAWQAVEIPVGIITSLLGGPFFIALLIRGRSRGRL